MLWAALQLRSERDSLLVATATNSMEMEMQAEAGEVALEGEVMAEQTFSPRAQLDPRTVEISAPRGQLGLVFDRGSTTLAKVKGSSPLSNLVQVGWALVAVNDVDVSDMDGWALTKLLQERAQEARRLLFQKPGQEEPEPVVYGEVMPATEPQTPCAGGLKPEQSTSAPRLMMKTVVSTAWSKVSAMM